MKAVINHKQRKHLRKKLRNNATKPEKHLWYYIRRRQINGIKFRRQCSIGTYIVDFFSFEKRVVIEVDGDSHFRSKEVIEYDRIRSKFIESQGIRIIRFMNNDVMMNTEGCIERLYEFLEMENE